MALRESLLIAVGSLSLVGLTPASLWGRPPWAGPRSEAHQADMQVFHFLLDHRSEIRRSVKQLPDGVETLTESDEPATAAQIRTHVRSMCRRVEEGRPIHLRDPLFAEIFAHADRIQMAVAETEKGMRVRETSTDPYVARLIQSHAEVVTQFLAHGHAEVRRNHPPPSRE